MFFPFASINSKALIMVLFCLGGGKRIVDRMRWGDGPFLTLKNAIMMIFEVNPLVWESLRRSTHRIGHPIR